jgi:chloramphenicol-sensitive protein RarD
MDPGARPSERLSRAGLACGVAAYGLWGLLPLYFKAIDQIGPLEVLCHRILGSAALLWAWVAWRTPGPLVRAALRPRTLGLLGLTGLLVAANWFVYIWAVMNGRVVEASLGYFINPLVSLALGVVVLGERLRPLAWAAVGLATVGVALEALQQGGLPWPALVLAFSFALYGLLRKLAPVEAALGLAVETALLAPLAATGLVWLGLGGQIVFLQRGAGLDALLLLAGLVTAVPLVLFNRAVRLLPLSTAGFLQYLAPSGQFLLGLLAFHEPMPDGRWLAFAFIWAALGLFSLDLARRR